MPFHPLTNPFDLSGKTAVVTGAGSGLGADAARAYAQAGASVALLDINDDGLEAVHTELSDAGYRSVAIHTDVSVDDDVKHAIEKTEKAFGQVDIVLNDAGTFARDSVENFNDEEWDHVFAVNLKGILHTSKYVIPGFKERRYGKIVNISSVNAVRAEKSEQYVRDSYFSSKAAVLGLTTALAARYAKYGITVNAIGPGLFKTGITANNFENPKLIEHIANVNPTGRYGQPGELNGAILFLSSDASSYVQGQFIIVDGGQTLV